MDATFARAPGIVVQQMLEDDFLLFDVQRGVFASLNEFGHDIFSSLNEPKSIVELADFFHLTFDVSREMLMKDLQTILSEMLSSGFVIVS